MPSVPIRIEDRGRGRFLRRDARDRRMPARASPARRPAHRSPVSLVSGNGGRARETESMRTLSEGYFLNSGLMKWSMGHYLNGPVRPRRSPGRAHEARRLFDPAADFPDDRRASTRGGTTTRPSSKRSSAAGVPATYRVLDSTIHGFMFMLGGIDLAVDAAKGVGNLISMPPLT